MWKYITKSHSKEFILSLDLIDGEYTDNEKLNILYNIANHSEYFYTSFKIDKKDGTKREILIPKPILKNIQKNLYHYVLKNFKVSKYAKGYIPNVSLVNNAKEHINKKIILKLDIKDFFNNITFEMLYRSIPNYIFPPSVKVLIIKLCTYYDYLPQGAPTSPMLSNIVLKNFDNYIGKYAEDKGISYTRYCDDLTFSGDFNVRELKNEVEAFLEELGFNLNNKKTKVVKNHYSQIVTGLVVNSKVNVPKTYRKKIRQEMYYIKKYGLENHQNYISNNQKNYIKKLKGRINYCLQINNNDFEMMEYLKLLKKID